MKTNITFQQARDQSANIDPAVVCKARRLARLRWAWALLSNNAPIADEILLDADKADDFTALQDAFGQVDPAGAPEPIQPLMLVDAWCALTLPYQV